MKINFAVKNPTNNIDLVLVERTFSSEMELTDDVLNVIRCEGHKKMSNMRGQILPFSASEMTVSIACKQEEK